MRNIILEVNDKSIILDPQAHHEESQDVQGDVGHRQQVHPGWGGNPKHQRLEEQHRARSLKSAQHFEE
jgi:hypothetical protein